jgi:hypothetical protein
MMSSVYTLCAGCTAICILIVVIVVIFVDIGKWQKKERIIDDRIRLWDDPDYRDAMAELNELFPGVPHGSGICKRFDRR